MRIGVDLGGTKIEAAALAADGSFLARRRCATPHDDYAATVTAVAALVAAVASEAGGDGPVGVATPGAVSAATGRIKNANSTWLNGKPFEADLATALVSSNQQRTRSFDTDRRLGSAQFSEIVGSKGNYVAPRGSNDT